MRYPWCDTVALILTFCVSAFLLLGGILLNAGDPFGPWIGAAGLIWLHLMGIIVLPLWGFLRAVDWLIAGPARRANRQ